VVYQKQHVFHPPWIEGREKVEAETGCVPILPLPAEVPQTPE